MRVISVFWLWLLGIFVTTLPGSALAQAGPPFACDGSIYQVQSGQLRIFDPITSSYLNVGPNNSSYNATGYNTLDNYAYASQNNRLIRISSNGVIDVVFNLGFGSFSGDVDFSNNYWLRRNNTRYARIDIGTGAVTNVDFTAVGGGPAPGGGPADVAFDVNGGDEYLIGFSGGGTLYRYNITNQTKENISVPGLPGGGYGATWTDSSGRLFTFSNNNGRLYEVTDYYTNSPVFTQVGIGVPSGNNDGFSCSNAPFPNLPPLAFDDDYTTPLNTAFSDNVITNNDNGIDNDPEGTAITVDTTPVTSPANGTLVLNANGDFTYTPDLYFFGTDTFEYEISDASGLTARAVVTITVPANPDFTVTKTQVAGPSPASSPSDMLSYEIVVTNVGDVPLNNVAAVDTLPDGSVVNLSGQVESGAAGNTPGVLDLGETWTYSTLYNVTQDDIDAGSNLINDVRVTADETGLTSRSDNAVTPISQNPSFTIGKSVDVGNLSAPGTLTYTIVVSNNGNQTLTGVSLTDALEQDGVGLALTTGPTLSGDTDGDGELDVGETWSYATTFAAGQGQIDDGADIVNTAEFDTDQTAAQSSAATTTITQNPSFTVSKSSDTMNLIAPGTINYQITLTNTGNTSITGLTPTDTLSQGATNVDLSGSLALSGDTDGDGELDIGETWIYAVSYAVDQDAIDDGNDIVNDISIVSDNGGTETSSTTTTISQSAGFNIVKSVDVNTLTAPGTLNYVIVVTNTGNVSLTGTSLVDDLTQGGALTLTSGPTLSGDTDADNEVDVGEVWTYVASFAADQTNIDDGADIVNEATFDAAEVAAQSDTATTSIAQTDALSLAKSVAAGEPTSFSAVGDTIDFTFVVTNTGNTTLVGPITIDDDQIGNGLACIAGNIAPGTSASCDITWTADQADLNAGSVTNVATAEDSVGNVSPSATETVTAVQRPALAIDKTIVAPIPGVFAAGEVLNYSYVVTNTGNVTLTQPITVSDNLTPNSIDTAPISCSALPAGGLPPLGTDPVGPTNSITCTAQYTLTGNDESLGSTTNIATAETTFVGAPVVSPIDSAVFPVAASPVLDLQKTAPAGLTVAEVGDTITYIYRVESIPPLSGPGAALPEVIFINDNKFAAPIVCYDPAVEGGSFNPGDVHVCTALYTVTQADLDAGEVVNEATANTVFAPSSPTPIDVVSNADTETVPVDADPELTVVKTVIGGPNPAAVGQMIDYRIVATNSGNQTLTNVSISDPLLGALTCDLSAPVTLNRTEVLTCEGSYTVQQSDLDGQTVGDVATAEFTNTARAVANDPSGVAIPPAFGSVDHPLAPAAPSVSVAKTLFPDPAADPAFAAVGDTVRYQIAVTNDGNMTLSSVDVTDSLVAGTCTVGPLAPGQTDSTCVFDYVVDQDDLDAGEVVNIGSATAQPIDPAADPVTGDDTLTSPGPDFDGALAVVKSGSLDLGANGVADVGDTITYTIVVENVGNVTLTDIAVTDPGADAVSYPTGDLDNDNDIDSLAPMGSVTVTATRALTQADIDAGQFANTATATGQDPSGDPVTDASDSSDPADGPGDDDPTVTPIPRASALTVDKSFTAAAGTGAGDTVTYSYLVTNTGNVTLTNVTLTDQHTSATGTAALSISNGGVIPTLNVGASATLTATYVVTQADVDAGLALTNVVDATATPPAGVTPPTATDIESVTVEAADPELEVLKTVRSQTGSAAGDTIVFEIAVENTGNVSLTNVVLTDTLRRVDNTAIIPAPTPSFESGDGGVASVLEVGETWVYTASYQLTQADVDAGGISNSVLAEAEAPDGSDVDDTSDNGAGTGSSPTVVQILSMPAIEAVKTITSSTISVGETVTFEITVENTGNVTLNSVQIAGDTLTRADGTVLSITGPSFSISDMGSLEGTLMVGETATYNASYVLVQADIDAGGIANTATAQGTPPVGSPVSDVSDDNGPGDDPTELEIPAAPVIALDKRLAAGGPSFDTVGDVLEYEFEITNLGNVTLSAPYAIDDPLIINAGGSVSCPTTDIAPMGSVICTGSYAVTQADIDAGQVDNTATATVGAAAPVSDSESVPAQQDPALSMVKTSEMIEAADFIVGATVTYTLTTTNTGNVTVTDPITINDSLIDTADIVCDPFPPAGLAPGASYICTGDYVVTADDVLIASVTNNASATDGTTTSPIDTVTIPNSGTPALEVTKELITSRQPDGTDSGTLTFDEVGDQLEYQFTVTNSGTVSFASTVEVEDTRFASPIDCFIPSAGNPDLTPGETAICTGTYIVTQDDLDAGEVLNEAFARTEFGSIPTIVLSQPDDVTTPAAADPMLMIEKVADNPSFAAVGESVGFDFTVTNTGNQTLSSIVVTDPLIPALVCGAATLPVGGVLNCSGSYTIQQADIDAGGLTNTATANAIDPRGAAIPPASDTASMTGPSVAPTIAVTKTANPDPFGAVGTGLTWTFEIENTSIYTLSNILVTDPLPGLLIPYTCSIASLAPGATNASCQLVTSVTQEMVDAGEFTNVVTVEGEDPFGNPATGTDTITVDGPAEDPEILATKTVDVPNTSEGTTITFSVRVENPGNVSARFVTLNDVMTRNDGTPLALDSGFVLVSGDVNFDNALNPTEVWIYEAPYTIVQDDINAGGLSNTVVVDARSPSGTSISDRSDDGDDTDGNTTDDPTEVPITTDPVLDVVKELTTSGAAAGDEILFTITATNRGNVDIFNTVIVDTLIRADGTDISADIVGPTNVTDPADLAGGELSPGESWIWEVRYTLTQEDIDAGGLSNTATGTGQDVGGNDVSDVSDNGDDADGNVTDDPTTLIIPPAPGIEAVKTVSEIGSAAGDNAVFEIVVTNTGNVTLSDLVLDDTLTNLNGGPAGPLDIVLSGTSAGDLAVGASALFTVTYVLTQADVDAGGLSNTATATGTTPGGQPASDVSDDGQDMDGNTLDDPTVALIASDPSAVLSKDATIPNRIGPNLFEVTFTLTLENTPTTDDDGTVIRAGNVTLTDLVIEDALQSFSAPATLVGVRNLTATGFTTGGGNPAYDGVTELNVLSAGTSLAPGQVGTVDFTVEYDTSTGQPGGTNTASVLSSELTTAETAVATIVASDEPDIFATKTARPDTVILGGTVVYELTFENRLDTQESNLTLVDILPDGIVYTPGSATLDGTATEPEISGRSLIWEPVSIAPNATVTLILEARVVGGAAGAYVNQAYATDSARDRVSNVATATVTRRPETVFECTDVIGKVFDDRNGNGVQDGVEEDRSRVTNQDFVGGKFNQTEEIEEEPGLAGVRLSTVTGTLITTDAYGRFSVPCAELPADIGSNVQLKLDTRTLPTGYHLTTENPRNLRATPGRMVRMNFGATLANLVELDLTAAAFADGRPNAALSAWLPMVMAELNEEPSVLRLTYYRGAEGEEAANANLDAIEQAIRSMWDDRGGGRLTLERLIRRVQ